MVEALPSRAEETAVPCGKGQQAPPGLGVLASVVLHGVALACVAGWNGEPAETPPAVEVAIMLETEPQAPPQTIPSAPPAPMPRPDPPARRAKHVLPGLAISAGTMPATVSRQAEPPADLSSADRSSASDGDQSATKDMPAAGTAGNGEGGTTSGDRPAKPAADNPTPIYPVSARHAGREGRTVLRVVVAANGDCKDVRIEESSGTVSLDEAAVTAVQRWRFTPAVRAGSAVETMIRVPIAFRLAGAPVE